MKKRKRSIFSLFARRKKSASVESYLERFSSLEKLVRNGLIGIDMVKAFVVLDVSVHLLYMRDDKLYNSFFDLVRAYINFHRGENQINRMVEFEDTIDFSVVIRVMKIADPDTGELLDEPEDNYQTLIIGIYKEGKVDYESTDAIEKKSEGIG